MINLKMRCIWIRAKIYSSRLYDAGIDSEMYEWDVALFFYVYIGYNVIGVWERLDHLLYHFVYELGQTQQTYF